MREKTWMIWAMRATRPEAKSKRPSRALSLLLSALRQSRLELICSRSWALPPSKQPDLLKMWAGSSRPTSQAPTLESGQRTTPTPSTGAAMKSSPLWCPTRPYMGKWASPGRRPQSFQSSRPPLPTTSATPLLWMIPRPWAWSRTTSAVTARPWKSTASTLMRLP